MSDPVSGHPFRNAQCAASRHRSDCRRTSGLPAKIESKAGDWAAARLAEATPDMDRANELCLQLSTVLSDEVGPLTAAKALKVLTSNFIWNVEPTRERAAQHLEVFANLAVVDLDQLHSSKR